MEFLEVLLVDGLVDHIDIGVCLHFDVDELFDFFVYFREELRLQVEDKFAEFNCAKCLFEDLNHLVNNLGRTELLV